MYGGSSTFDGNAAFSGGGFMPSQATQTTTDHGFSPAKNRDVQTLLPVTVKQIIDAFQASNEKADFQIDGVDVNNVKLVGILYELRENVTDVSFVLDDGTGRVTCRRWASEEADNKETELLKDGIYVSVHGHLKGFLGKRQLVVFSIRPVTDFNEITHHFAESIYVHCYNTKQRKMQDAGPVPGHMANSSIISPSKGYQATASNHFPIDTSEGGDIYNLVLKYLNLSTSLSRQKGVHRDELAQNLNLDPRKINESILALEAEGLIYHTIDDDHFKSTTDG